MASTKFWLYIHSDKKVIYKRYGYDPTGRDFAESPFCLQYELIEDAEDAKGFGVVAVDEYGCPADQVVPVIMDAMERNGM